MASTNVNRNDPMRGREGKNDHSSSGAFRGDAQAARDSTEPPRATDGIEIRLPRRFATLPNDPLLTPELVAERLNVSPDWVRDHSSRKSPRLPVIRLGGGPGRAGLLRYRASDIERFIDGMARLSERRARAV